MINYFKNSNLRSFFYPAIFLIFLFSALFWPVFFANGGPPELTNNVAFTSPLKAPNLFCFLKDIVDVALTIGVIVAVIFIIYSGFLFVTAKGSVDRLRDARTAFFGAVIGTAVLMGVWLFALVIANTIDSVKSGEGVNLGTLISSCNRNTTP